MISLIALLKPYRLACGSAGDGHVLMPCSVFSSRNRPP